MYADDIILLARSQTELAAMNRIASAFAQRNRFQFNGEKSAVMAFNATCEERALCKATRWELFGEAVNCKVAPSYVYLGTIVPEDGIS